VYFFQPTEGLDADTCKVFNEYTQRLRTTFESKMHTLSDMNFDLSQKVALYESEKKVSELTAA